MRKILSFALAAAIATAPGAAMAQPNGIQLRFVWYADDSMTTVVGEVIHFCDGNESRWGEATPYRYDESNEC